MYKQQTQAVSGVLKSKWIEGREWKSEGMSEEEEWSTGGEGVSATVLF